MRYIIGTVLFFFSFLNANGNFFSDRASATLLPLNSDDTVPEKRSFGTLKINPLQILASEIPVSLEMYLPGEMSLQVQIGYIFPTKKIADWLESTGPGGGVALKGLFDYRIIPYNNNGGVNFKIEFRKYFRSIASSSHAPYQVFYLAPQLTYKYCYYNNQTFLLDPNGIPYYQKESKDSNIFGFGFMLGRQSCWDRFVTDWYAGVGFRNREIKNVINDRWMYYNQYPVYSGTETEYQNSFYLIVNFSVRFGFEL
jgi:hypothetical protein